MANKHSQMFNFTSNQRNTNFKKHEIQIFQNYKCKQQINGESVEGSYKLSNLFGWAVQQHFSYFKKYILLHLEILLPKRILFSIIPAQRNIYMRIFTAALFVIGIIGNSLIFLQETDKIRPTHTLEFYAVIKKKEKYLNEWTRKSKIC